MKRKKIIFEKVGTLSAYRCLLKNQHGRKIYMELVIGSEKYIITACWYFDRNIGKTGDKRKSAEPLLWKTKETDSNIKNLKRMLVDELDMTPFLEIDFVENTDTVSLSSEEFILHHTSEDKYRFLILIKSETEQGIFLESVFKNKTHRRIYIKLALHKDKKAYIVSCHYCDRVYKQYEKKTPETLVEGYIENTERNVILRWFNSQFTCDFNTVLYVSPDDVEINKNRAICGNI